MSTDKTLWGLVNLEVLSVGESGYSQGFWEDRDILRINEALLAALQSTYDRVGLLDPDERTPVIDALESEARRILTQKFTRVDFFAIKDPRLARLLPFWQRVFAAADLAVDYVIALRNPLSVVDSLAKRDGFDRVKSALLWQEHELAAVYYTHGKRRVVVDYDQLLDDPETAFRRIAAYLGVGCVHLDALRDYEANFLDTGLRHTRYTRSDVLDAPDLPQGVRDLYFILADCAEDLRGLDDPALVRLIAQQREALHAIGPVLDFIGRLEERVQHRTRFLAEQDLVCTEIEQTLTDVGEAHAQAQGEVQRLREKFMELRETIAELTAQVNELKVLHSSRLWRLRDTIRMEPWSLGKSGKGPPDRILVYLPGHASAFAPPTPDRPAVEPVRQNGARQVILKTAVDCLLAGQS